MNIAVETEELEDLVDVGSNTASAKLAWQRTIDFFNEKLA